MADISAVPIIDTPLKPRAQNLSSITPQFKKAPLIHITGILPYIYISLVIAMVILVQRTHREHTPYYPAMVFPQGGIISLVGTFDQILFSLHHCLHEDIDELKGSMHKYNMAIVSLVFVSSFTCTIVMHKCNSKLRLLD